MYNTANSALSDALKREGKVITSYSDNTHYNVIFRRNSDKNKLQNTVTIFYSADSNIHAGQLLKYKDKIYLSINQESSENDTYLKSDLRQTNAIMNYIKGGTEFSVPSYAYDVNNALAINNNVLSIVNGNIELLAEDNSITRALEINDCFYALGGYWKINNLIFKDNVIYIYVTREVTSITYTVTVNADDSYDKGTTAQFTAIAKADDTIVSNANIVWSSSNTSIATVDSNGIVTFFENGNVDISATWQEHNITSKKSITVTEPPVYGLTITADDTYITTDTPTLLANATINGATDSDVIITWSSSDETIATIDSTGKVTFLTAGDVIFTATWTEHDITATKEITVSIPKPTTQYTCKITNSFGSVEWNDTTDIATIKIGGSTKPFMCHFYDANGTEVNLTPTWLLDVSSLPTEKQAEVHLTYKEDYPLRAYLNADDDYDIIGLQVRLILTDSDKSSEPKTIPVNIIAF